MSRRNMFALAHTAQKWEIIHQTMREISASESAFSMRRRLNPHHSSQDVKDETRAFRIEQYQKWCEIKDLYAEFRDEMANTAENSHYEQCKNILERIFTEELDEALRQTLDE